MAKPCFPVSTISSFLCCLFVSSFFVNSLVSLPFPHPDQIEILLAFKNEFPILKCDIRKWSESRQKTKSWTSKVNKSFDGVWFDSETGLVTELDLSGACLSGSLSANSSLFRLHHLRYLDLSNNYFDSFSFLPELAKLTNLEILDLSHMGLAGEIPTSVSSLNRLRDLDLSGNELIGSFSPLINLSRLSYLSLSNNHFSGNVPCSLLTIPSLSILYLSQNHLIGTLETMNCYSTSMLESLYLSNNRLSSGSLEPLSKFFYLKDLDLSFQNTTDPVNFVSLGFKSLESLDLSGNAISRLNIRSPNLKELALNECSINEFPTFIKNLPKLKTLRIANNSLKGEVPKWLWSMPSLIQLSLSHNSLDSFEGSPKVVLNSSLYWLDLSSNAFRGSLPIVSPTLNYMFASNNSFSGDIPLSLCNQNNNLVLDLSQNHFSGSIPGCLFTSLVYLNLRNNNLTGNLPNIFDKSSYLITLDVSHNQITGKLPRSLTNCTNLEFVNVGSNRIADSFPFWLKDLPNLQVIVLQSNMFHGPIYSPQHPLSFPQLRIMDISGHVPSSWAKLTRLESLDLSRNQLSGKIPQELATLSFLEYIDVSHNKLTGQIPQSTQIGGQPKSSFEGNINLCGLPLEQSCFSDKVPSTPEAQGPWPQKQEQVLNWKAAAMGYGPGVLFGLAIGQVFYSYKPVLFFKLFRL
ncbi:receptor-like protein 54 isoform X2 [Brassica napus]|uniref:receptor-like protein 54 isoform X2 n=1 Tax=Brassica napus TaxID=3708 RepID=UPI0006AB3954|nr:receptor-like protein 54 isoform X2 [Brassica napus]